MNCNEFPDLRRDYLERRIFLKRQLISLTEKEIEVLSKELTDQKECCDFGAPQQQGEAV